MYKYNGKGFIFGVPARNLTEQEARDFGIDRILASGFWEKPKKSKRLEAADAVMEG